VVSNGCSTADRQLQQLGNLQLPLLLLLLLLLALH
jgi:hypothetical protein